MSVSMDKEKKRLALIWFVGAGLLFCLVLIQSVRNVYGTQTEKAWAWLLPSVMPTLSLIVGVLVSDVAQQGRVDIQVDPFVPMLAAISSCVYLVIVSATILLQPLSQSTPLTLMNMSHLWLAPLQGLVSGLMGALFVKQK